MTSAGTAALRSSRGQLAWAALAAVLVVVGLAEIANDRWSSPWPVSVVALLLVGVPVAAIGRSPAVAATVVCLAFGVECLVWSTPQSLAALLALALVAAGAAHHAPARTLLPVLGLVALTVVVVLSPDPDEDAAYDVVLTLGLLAVATGTGLLSRDARWTLPRRAARPSVARPTVVASSSDVRAPRPQVFLHVGLPKTGTSFLQSALAGSGPALQEQGLALLPHSGTTAFQVMLDLRGELRPDLDPPEHFGALDRLVEQVLGEEQPRVLVSQELLALADADQAGRLVAALEGCEVHVVLTVRDLARQLPSLWQQQVKARGITSYRDFLERIVADESGTARGYDPLAVLAQWRHHVPPERTHVVTVPRPGSAAGLPSRFCEVLGLDPTRLDTSVVEGNQSLGMAQAELLRRVNLALGRRLPHPRAGYRGPGKRWLAETILIQQDGAPPRLPERLRPWVEARSAELVAALRAEPYDVIGDLDELVPDPTAFVPEVAEAPDSRLLDVATEALAAVLVERAAGRRRRPRSD